jgi:hypothetical protein
MRLLLPCLAILLAAAAHAQLLNGDFEQGYTATNPPSAAWTLQTNLLPEKWNYNAQYGGPVGLVPDAHGGQYALHFSASPTNTAHVLGATFPVKPGEVYELSGWAKGGTVELTFYEYGAANKWLRTAPAVTRLQGGNTWVQGGGYHLISDPQVTQLTVVLSTDKQGVTVDDIVLRKVERTAMSGPDVVLENQGCRLTLAADGSVKAFFDKTLKAEQPVGLLRPFMRAKLGAWNIPASALTRSGDLLTVTFGDNKAKAYVQLQTKPYYLGFILKSCEPALSAITLFDLQLPKLATVGNAIGAVYDDQTMWCVQTLHYDGQQVARQSDATSVNFTLTFPDLTRPLYGKNPVRGGAFLTCPRDQFFPVMGEVEKAYGLPSPRLQGKPGKLSPLMKRSYFFVTDLSEANVDEVIAYAKRGHFGYVLIVEHAWSQGSGSFIINERNFPHGLDGLKATIGKIQKAGFPVGLHMLTAGINMRDPLITPVPDNGLYVDMQLELAADLDAKATFIPTKEPPTDFPTEDGGYRGTGTILRLGDEMVQYGKLKLDPPYGFEGCTRGWNKSVATKHPTGTAVKHLYRAYGLFLIDTHTDLLDRVADNVAKTWNYCGCDGIYFDGSEWLQGDHAYYNARLQMAYYERFNKRDIIAQGSSYSAYTWHLISRMASADGFRDIKLYLDKRSPGFQWSFNNFMPLDIGWYAINPNIRPDDIEYVCSRALAFDSSISIETGLANLKSVPQAGEMIDMIARWEDLRLSGRVPEAIRQALRQPGNEVHLTKVAGQDALVPVHYSDWGSFPATRRTVQDDQQKETVVEMPAELRVKNPRLSPATVALQLEAGPVVQPGPAYAAGQPLELFEGGIGGESKPLDTNQYDPAVHGSRATSQGVTQEVKLITDDVKEGQSACLFRAVSTLATPGGWATFGRRFDPPLELKDYHYLGLWVKGDASGAALKVQLWDAAGKPQDQYVTINWTGWRFLELAKPDPPLLDYTKIVSLNFYYNGMPANSTCTTVLDGLKVLARASETVNPAIVVNGVRIVFPTKMKVGDRLVFTPDECWLYPSGTQDKLKITPQGQLPPPTAETVIAVDDQTVANQILFRARLLWPAEAIAIPK